jgi:ribosomal protein S21
LNTHSFIMAIEVKRKSNESNFSFLRRFQDRIKKGRVLNLAKKGMYYEKPISERQTKEDALRRKNNREKREYMIRTGQITEEPTTIGGGRFKRK